MKFSIIIAVCCSVAVTTSALAQQMPFSSQYYTNQFVINPAMTGSTEYAKAFLSHRSQFSGLEGGPQTSYFSVDGQIADGKIGLGLAAFTDNTDILARNSAMLNYSYGIRLGTSHSLRFGMAMGVQNNRVDYDKAMVVNEADPILFGSRQSKTVFNADFGMAYTFSKLQVGFAIPQLLTRQPGFATNTGANLIYSTSRHLRATAKYDFTISESKGITAYPMVMIRAVKGAPIQWDVNGVIDIKKWGWFGITYHNSYAIAFSAGFRYKNLSIGYAHDFVLSKVSNFSKRSSEFMLSYQFGENFNKQKQINEQHSEKLTELENRSVEQSRQIDSLKQEQRRLNEELIKIQDSIAAHTNEIDTLNSKVNELQNSIEKVPFNNPAEKLNKDGFRMGFAKDYLDEVESAAPVGYYVVIGAFGIKENAYKQKAKSIEQGQTQTSIILNTKTGLRNVILYYSMNKEEAITEKLKYTSIYEKVWILKLD